MSPQHGLGTECGKTPTYTCWCGFSDTSYETVARHISAENTRARIPRRLTTISDALLTPPAGLEIASTALGDAFSAIEIRLVIRESEGHYRRHSILVRRDNLTFLIKALEDHRLDTVSDTCPACAARAFAFRLTDDARQIVHTCPEPPQGLAEKISQ